MKMKKKILAVMTAAVCSIGTLSVPISAFADDPTPKTMIEWYIEENNINGKTYNFIKNGNDAVCIEVDTLTDAEKVKAFIEERGFNKELIGLFCKENDGIDMLKSKEESIINVAGFISQYMEQNKIEGFIYPTEGNAEFIIVCKTEEGISQIKTFVTEKGYNTDRLEFMLPDFEVNPSENVPETLEEQMTIIESFMNQEKIGGKAEICEYKGEKKIRVVLDAITDKNTRTLEYFITQYGMDINNFVFDAVGRDAVEEQQTDLEHLWDMGTGGEWYDPLVDGDPYGIFLNNRKNGDANCDGEMSMADAVIIMQSIANPSKYGVNGTHENHITEQGQIHADITGNNDGVTNADALAIQKKLLGITDEYKFAVDWHSQDLSGFSWNDIYEMDRTAVIKDSNELKSYLEKFYNNDAVSEYLEKYKDDFFTDNVLLLDTVIQGAGDKVGCTISSVTISDKISISLKSILDEESADAVMSLCLAQVPISANYYNGQEVEWKINDEMSAIYGNDEKTDKYEYLINNNSAVMVPASVPQSIALNCDSFCKKGETLKVDMAMGDRYSYNEKFNGYPTSDSDGYPEYTISAFDVNGKIKDENIIINGEKSGYIKELSKDDMKALDITDSQGDYDSYYHETAEIDFSDYGAGSTGCIVFGFGWKIISGENPYNPTSDFMGTSKSLYYYVGDDGIGISTNGWENAERAYKEKSEDDIIAYDSFFVKWNGKPVTADLHQKLRKESDEIIPITVQLSSGIDSTFEYNGKTLAEYGKDKSDPVFEKYEQLLLHGDYLKYGEAIYTTGAPDGRKYVRGFYDEIVETIGEDIISKYIVDGEFLKDKLQEDVKSLKQSYDDAFNEAETAYYRHIADIAVKQLDEQNIKYEFQDSPVKRFVIFVKAGQFKELTLDNVSQYYLAEKEF